MPITTLLLSLSANYAPAAAPVVGALPVPVKKDMKKSALTLDDKDQSAIEDPKEAEARAPLIDQEISVAENIFKGPNRNAQVKLKISGNSQIDLGMTAQEKTDNKKYKVTNTSNIPYLHVGSTKLKFEASVRADKMIAGWVMRFNAQVNDAGIDRNGIFWKHDDYGQIDAGNIRGVDDSLFKFAQRLIGGSNGWDSGLPTLFVLPEEAYHYDGTNFIGASGIATKISYITPKLFDALTIGVSYTPNTAHQGSVGMAGSNLLDPKGSKATYNPSAYRLPMKDGKPQMDSTEGQPVGTNNITFVTNIHKKIGKWAYGLAFTYIHDTSDVWYTKLSESEQKKYRLNDVNSWGVSYLIGYDRFSLGMEYMNNGKSRLPVDDTLSNLPIEGGNAYTFKDGHKGHAGHAVTVTGQYKWTDKLVSSTGFQWTNRKLNPQSETTRKTLSQTFDYHFMPGLQGYIEGDMIWLNRKDNGKDNKDAQNTGFVVVIGARVQI